MDRPMISCETGASRPVIISLTRQRQTRVHSKPVWREPRRTRCHEQAFLFRNYEGNRQRQDVTSTLNVYTDAQKAGNFSSSLGARAGQTPWETRVETVKSTILTRSRPWPTDPDPHAVPEQHVPQPDPARHAGSDKPNSGCQFRRQRRTDLRGGSFRAPQLDTFVGRWIL